MESLGKRLRQFRNRSGLSAREVAERVGVAESTYREWEFGRKIQGEEPYPKLAATFGISLSRLIEGEDPAESGEAARDLQTIEECVKRLKTRLTFAIHPRTKD